MCYRYFQGLLNAFASQVYILTHKLLVNITKQYARKQFRFAKDLESITNTQYMASFFCKTYNALHHRAEAGYRAVAAGWESGTIGQSWACTDLAEL